MFSVLGYGAGPAADVFSVMGYGAGAYGAGAAAELGVCVGPCCAYSAVCCVWVPAPTRVQIVCKMVPAVTMTADMGSLASAPARHANRHSESKHRTAKKIVHGFDVLIGLLSEG